MADAGHDEHNHPGVTQYVEIGVILAVITAIEVGLFFANVPAGIEVPALLILTAMKFFLVILWFMHLRFDHKLFRRLFFIGVALAVAVFGIVASIFYLGSGYAAPFGPA